MTGLNSTIIRLIRIEEPDPEIWGEESSSKWDRLEIVLAPKWRVNTKVDPSKLDPNLKVIISQCDIYKRNNFLFFFWKLGYCEIVLWNWTRKQALNYPSRDAIYDRNTCIVQPLSTALRGIYTAEKNSRHLLLLLLIAIEIWKERISSIDCSAKTPTSLMQMNLSMNKTLNHWLSP
jgi:hypothetical protein